MSCSANGSVVLAKQVEGVVVGRPQQLQCREKHAQCSLAACTINGQVAAGSMEGSITMWDTESGLAKHHLQDEVCAFRRLAHVHTESLSSSATARVWRRD